MAELLGVENFKKLIKFSCGLTKQINSSTADGWQWTDALQFIDEATEVPGIAKSFSAIAKELADLSEAERDELKDFVQTEFDIPNDNLEVVLENSIMQAISLVALVNEWRKIGDAKNAN